MSETELHPKFLTYGGSLQYSMPYLKSSVKDLGLPEFLNHLIPLVEWSLTTEVSNFDGEERTTGTIRSRCRPCHWLFGLLLAKMPPDGDAPS